MLRRALCAFGSASLVYLLKSVTFNYGFDGSLDGVGIDGFYPSASSYTLNSLDVSGLHIVETGDVYPDGNDNRANANPVRCVRVID